MYLKEFTAICVWIPWINKVMLPVTDGGKGPPGIMSGYGLLKFEFTLPVFFFHHTGGIDDPV